MPKIQREDLPSRQIKISVELTVEELQPFLEEAARQINQRQTIPGFRPGKAPLERVAALVGEMRVLEEAVESVVQKTLSEFIKTNKIETVGSPKIDPQKIAPGNPLIFTAEFQLLPIVEKMADLSQIKIPKKEKKIGDGEVETSLLELRKVQRKEIRGNKESPLTSADKAVIDLTIKKDGVVVDGGVANGYSVYLSEPHYIPGFTDELIGLSEGQEKTFSLNFPKGHYQKLLAGQPADFTVAVREIYHLELPAADDAFATSLGQKTISGLREILQKNLEKENTEKEIRCQEAEAVQNVVAASRFSEIPEIMINWEVETMINELKQAIEESGGRFDDYLTSLHKTLSALKLDLAAPAIERIKAAMILRELSQTFSVMVDENELDLTCERLIKNRPDEKDRARIFSPEFRARLSTVIRNKKTTEKLREMLVV